MPNADLPYITPPSPLYRIARKPDPWAAPDWAQCQDDLTFGNRFDDCSGKFRVLYTSSSRLGCFVETLSRFRIAPEAAHLAQAFRDIVHSPDDFTPSAHVPASWLARRLLGIAESRKPRFADIYSSEWLAYLRRTLDRGYFQQAAHAGQDFDLAALMSQQRRLTQQIASLVYELGFDGIRYQSRHGIELVNWAVFEPYELDIHATGTLAVDDRDFINALYRLNLGLALNL